jgi:hypothetical protein
MGYYEAITKVTSEMIPRQCLIRQRKATVSDVLLEDAP